jgi:hypothetical protein
MPVSSYVQFSFKMKFLSLSYFRLLLQHTHIRYSCLKMSITDKVIPFFNWPNPSSRTMALGLTQPLTEMSTRNLDGSKGQPAHKADNVTTMCKRIV